MILDLGSSARDDCLADLINRRTLQDASKVHARDVAAKDNTIDR